MTAAWIVTAALFIGTVALKAAGPLALGGRQPSDRALAVIALVAPSILTSLVLYQTFTGDPDGLTIDARAVGLAVAAIAAVARLPMIVVVALAALATAVTRALT
jgi:Branched-chain amino acid transport protein (AzlD)